MVLVATCFTVLALLFAPQKGLLFRVGRLASFRLRCIEENILKNLWKKEVLSFQEIRKTHPNGRLFLLLALFRLIRNGWIVKKEGGFHLSGDGRVKSASIIRLHRLWELYLTRELGKEVEMVHRSAEEMEHILTPDLEKKLTFLLEDPKVDPHKQPIPERRGL